MNIVIYALFALSGFAGLIYEGSWARYLKLFLGHSSYGQVLTLCIYMGGLAIGSFVAGKLVERVKRPLLGYAAVELAIGIGGLIYHPMYIWITDYFYDSNFVAGLSSRGAEILKVVLATGSTLPIAIAVGMTFPFIAAGLMRKSGAEVSLPMLYFTNSLGSAIGILFTSYILIPSCLLRCSALSAIRRLRRTRKNLKKKGLTDRSRQVMRRVFAKCARNRSTKIMWRNTSSPCLRRTCGSGLRVLRVLLRLSMKLSGFVCFRC